MPWILTLLLQVARQTLTAVCLSMSQGMPQILAFLLGMLIQTQSARCISMPQGMLQVFTFSIRTAMQTSQQTPAWPRHHRTTSHW